MEKAVLNDEQLDNVTGGSRITYTVKSGDTLEGIAKQMGVPDGRPGAEGQVLIGSLPKRMNAAARGRNPARRIPFI